MSNIHSFVSENSTHFINFIKSNEIYEHEQSADNYFRELDEYVQYINDTMRKAKGAGCQIMTYAEEAFGIYLINKTEIILKYMIQRIH